MHAAREAPWLHPGQGAVLAVGATDADAAAAMEAGLLGEVHPDVRARFGIETRAFAFEIDLGALGAPAAVTYRPWPRFPGTTRDVSFFVDRATPVAALRAVIATASTLIESVHVLEDYREPGKVPPDRKGLLLSLFYRSRERTLTDEEANVEHDRVVESLKSRFGIAQR